MANLNNALQLRKQVKEVFEIINKYVHKHLGICMNMTDFYNYDWYIINLN